MKKFYTKYTLGICSLFIVFSSCKHEGDYHSINDKIKAESKAYDGVSVTSDLSEVNTIEITEGEDTFLILERESQIKSFKCTECHTKPVAEMTSKELKKAHWDIKLNHADSNTLNCVTCHNGDNMDYLTSITGNAIRFNNSHQLCSQCHTKQYVDWKGGAHGKEVGGCAPPRASLTCVNCHNPHEPHFESRWPARFNTKKEKQRE